MSNVRVRFAPSPTGFLHVGGVRTALYNFLFARKHGGSMVLRIEDTDQSRYVEGAEHYILEALKWSQIELDEGPEQGGPYGPYRQSERKHIYKDYALQLIEEGKAYYAFDTPEDLDAMREKLKAAKVANQQYNAATRMSMKNSLTLSKTEVSERLASGAPYVIRINIPGKQEVRFEDKIRGWVKVHSSNLDDKVLLKSDGMPTYHLANVVDDYLMKISHVIRGEEWIPSAPLHVLLYEYLGWEDATPEFAHLPLLLKPDGNGKLSKRDAEKHGFPIFPLNWTDPGTLQEVMGFREAGYLQEAFINFLALLGWNPGNDQEIFSMEELIEAFSIDHVHKAGARFDINKAKWFNQHYIREKDDGVLADELLAILSPLNIECSRDKAVSIVRVMKDRVTFPRDFWEMGAFFFLEPKRYDEKMAAKKWTPESSAVLKDFAQAIEKSEPLDPDQLKSIMHDKADAHGVKIGKVMPALRLALTGGASGPDLMDIVTILGNSEAAKRIYKAIGQLD